MERITIFAMILANMIPGTAMIFITNSTNVDEIWNVNDRVIITIPSLKAKPFFGCNKKDKKTEGKSIDKQELFCALKQTFFFLR